MNWEIVSEQHTLFEIINTFTVTPYLEVNVTGSHNGRYDSNTDYNYRFLLHDFNNRVSIQLGGFMIRDTEIRNSKYSNNPHSIAEDKPNKFIQDAFWNGQLAVMIWGWYRRDNIRKVARFIRNHDRCPSSKEYKKMNLMEALK